MCCQKFMGMPSVRPQKHDPHTTCHQSYCMQGTVISNLVLLCHLTLLKPLCGPLLPVHMLCVVMWSFKYTGIAYGGRRTSQDTLESTTKGPLPVLVQDSTCTVVMQFACILDEAEARSLVGRSVKEYVTYTSWHVNHQWHGTIGCTQQPSGLWLWGVAARAVELLTPLARCVCVCEQ